MEPVREGARVVEVISTRNKEPKLKFGSLSARMSSETGELSLASLRTMKLTTGVLQNWRKCTVRERIRFSDQQRAHSRLPACTDFLLKLIMIGESPRSPAAISSANGPTLALPPRDVSNAVKSLLGDSGTGKSSLLHQFIYKRSRTPAQHTIGVEFASTLLHLSAAPSSLPTASSSRPTSKTLKCQIFDTAGQERFRSVTRKYATFPFFSFIFTHGLLQLLSWFVRSSGRV